MSLHTGKEIKIFASGFLKEGKMCPFAIQGINSL